MIRDELKTTIELEKIRIQYQRQQLIDTYKEGMLSIISYYTNLHKLDSLEQFYEAYLAGELTPVDKQHN